MKRSEALDIIDHILMDNECSILKGIDKQILGALEKVGMLPPKFDKVFSLHKNDTILTYRNTVNEWENE